MAVNTMKDAAFRHDQACDCCGHDLDKDRLEALGEAIKADPSFIGEAIANIDLTQLVDGYQKVDLQLMWDAVSDIVDAHYEEQLRYCRGDVDKLATAHGVEL